MRFFRFLVRELLFHGIFFAVAGTVALSALYLLSIGAPAESYMDAVKSFVLFITGSANSKTVGFTSGQNNITRTNQTYP